MGLRISEMVPGLVIGTLTVLAPLEAYREKDGHMRYRAQVQCTCGHVYHICTSNLTSRKAKNCPACVDLKKPDPFPIGFRSDRLVIVGWDGEKKNKKAICKCDCGNMVTIRAYLLIYNQTNNCGCAPRGSWKGKGKLSGTYLCRVRRNAKVRGLSFTLTSDELWLLYQKQEGKCALSGLPISFGAKTVDPSTASLDRIDSTKGYTSENIQWVHKDINLMKMDFEQEYFKHLCTIVSQYGGKTVPPALQRTAPGL